MRRSTPSRRSLFVPAILVVAGLAAIAGVASLWLPTAGPRDQTFSGSYTTDADLRIANLTINGGQVIAGYTVEVLYLPLGDSSGMHCEMVDTSGRIDFFRQSRTVAPPGKWTPLAFEGSFDLPELTLGIRCSPNTDGAMTAVFRDAELHVANAP